MQSYTKPHPPALGLLLGAEFGGSLAGLSLSDEAGGGGGGRWETGAATDCDGGICFFPEGGGAWGSCFLTEG